MTVFSPKTLSLSPQAIADYFTQSPNLPGAIISVTDGQRTATVASGTDEVDGAPMHHTQSYEIGSQTKMMTGLVVLELAKEGLIDLDAPLASYLDPALTDGIANADIATVRQALQMTTGIVNYTSAVRPDGTSQLSHIADNPDKEFGTAEILALLKGLPASAPVNQTYEYSNTNYFYLSKVIEAVSGQSLGQVFHDRIFAPLGMEDSYLNDFRANPDLVNGHFLIDGEIVDMSWVKAHTHGEGGVVSTAADMTTFLKALLVDKTLASPEVLEMLLDFDNGSTDPRGFDFNYGLGQFTFDGIGTFVGFSGHIFGSESATYLHLESGRIFSAMVNLGNGEASSTGLALSTALELQEDTAWQQPATGEDITVDDISAAALQIETIDGVSFLVAEDARLKLAAHIQTYDSDDFIFTDGSALHLGTNQSDTLTVASDASGGHHLRGFAGKDRLKGGSGDDYENGGFGHDVLSGHRGNDVLVGAAGNDTLRGGKGADTLKGGNGDDRLFGGQGKDVLSGGTGDDKMTGGRGADVFVFSASQRDGQADHDIITDYQAGTDHLSLQGRSVTRHAVEDTGLTLTLDGDGDTIFLRGLTDISDLSFL